MVQKSLHGTKIFNYLVFFAQHTFRLKCTELSPLLGRLFDSATVAVPGSGPTLPPRILVLQKGVLRKTQGKSTHTCGEHAHDSTQTVTQSQD